MSPGDPVSIDGGEARQRYLLRLGEALRPLAVPAGIQREALRMLGMHVGAAWAYYGEYDGEAMQMVVRADYRREGQRSLVGIYPIASLGLLNELMAGRTTLVDDIATSPLFSEASREHWHRLGMRSLVAVPIVKEGNLIAALVLADDVPRDWHGCVAAMEATAERTWATVERARAEMQLRESEAKLHQQKMWLAAQHDAFQAAINGASLETSLGIIVDAVAAWADDGRRCAFYIADAKGQRLSHVVGMPDAYAAAIEGLAISGESVACGLAVATGSPVITPDVLDDARWEPWTWLARQYGYRGCWSFPVETAAGKRVGSFAFYFREPHQANAADYELAAAMAHTAAIIISRHQENQERVRIERQQAFLLELSDALRPLREPSGIQAESARRLGRFLGADRVFYAEVDEADRVSVVAEHRGWDTRSFIGDHGLDDFGRACADTLRAGRTLVMADVRQEAGLSPDELQAYAALGIVAKLKVPLVKDGRLAAMLGVHQQAVREWTPGEVALVSEVAERTWVAVGRARAEAALSAELAAMQALHALSTIAFRSSDVTAMLEAGLDATMELHGADFGHVQLYEPASRTLHLAAQRGFTAAFAEHFERVDAREVWSCGMALAARERIIVTDAQSDPRCAAWRPMAREAGFRAVQSTPLLSAAGEPLGMLSTHFREPRRFSESEQRLTDLIAREISRVIERTRGQAALRESEERLRSAAQVGRLGLWDWNVHSGEVHWSDEMFRMAGYAVGEVEPSYEAWLARMHPDDVAELRAGMRRAMEAREEFVREFRVVHADGSIRWLYGRGRFFYDAKGQPARMIGTMVDTTERREWEEQQEVLIAELQHRTRNLVGVIRSMADKTARRSADLAVFREHFGDRLEALARVQGLLSRLNEHDRVAFDDLIGTELAAMDDNSGRVTLEGPSGVRLRSASVQILAMALHELATNAVKYGALAQPQARLAIRWRVESPEAGGPPWLNIEWRESGVAMPAEGEPPRGSGQGRELIERALPYQLSARTSFVLGPDGVECTIAMPLPDPLHG